MGCGSSAKSKEYKADPDAKPAAGAAPAAGGATKPADAAATTPAGTTPADATAAKPAEEPDYIGRSTSDQPATGPPRKRPSLSRDVIDLPAHEEGHVPITAKDTTDDQDTMGQRPSMVQTKMEMVWMDDIPAMYGVSDSDDLPREELQEDAQAEKVKECVSRPKDVESILIEWMHDCPDKAALDAFIAKTKKTVDGIDAGEKAKKKVQIAAGPDGQGRAMQRKGTGFVTAGQVRALMAQDFGDDGSEDSESANEEEDAAFEAEMSQRLQKQEAGGNTVRQAVASETTAVPEGWVAPFFQKTPDQRKRLADAVSESFMFAALGYDQLQPVIDAFEEVKIEAGVKVIEQDAEVGPNDRGLYVLESGELDVFKKGVENKVFTYTEMGQYFGDLALLYNAPRSATVVSSKPSVLWCIDRTTFNALVKDAVQKAKQRRMDFLASVEILKSLNVDEVAKIGDALRERSFGSGVNIIQEGGEGDCFYILEKGRCAAIKEGKRLKEYEPADYFGELALISHAARACDIKTLEDCTVLSLDRNAFNRLLGPLDTLMKERAASYETGAAA